LGGCNSREIENKHELCESPFTLELSVLVYVLELDILSNIVIHTDTDDV